jgi:hypothetical protein
MFSCIIFISSIIAQSILEPPEGKKLFGISLVNELEPVGRDPWKPSEAFVTFNERTGFRWSVHHLVQEIPRKVYPPIEYIDQTKTDAILHLTIIPTTGWSSVTEADVEELAKQCEDINMRGRGVFLRFAPDFNCPWHIWGMQPIRFKRAWIQLHTKLRERPMANMTAMVWSAFEGNNYPFGEYNFSPRNNTDEFIALDTNRDGILNLEDNPYSPFFPNDTHTVDWVGLSIFWRPQDPRPRNNTRPADDYISRIITGVNRTNFYQDYSERFDKPMMISDTGAFFYRRSLPNLPPLPGISELELKSAWWDQLLSLPKQFRKIKMISFSDIRLTESHQDSTYFLDARFTTNTTIFESFQKAIGLLSGAVVWASASDIVSWPNNFTIPRAVSPEDSTNLQNLIILSILPIPVITVVVWLLIVSFRQLRARNVEDANSEPKVEPVEAVDDCSTILGSEIDSQITTSEDGLAFEDEDIAEPDPNLFDHIVISPRIHQ